MKKQKTRNDSLLLYCDMSLSNELKLKLISNLLIQSSEGLDVEDARELGCLIRSFLLKKILLDNHFWKRAIPKNIVSDEEKEAGFKEIATEIFTFKEET